YAANSLVSAVLTVAGVAYLIKYVRPSKELQTAAFVLMCGSAGFLVAAFIVLYRRTYLASAFARTVADLMGAQHRAAAKLDGVRRTEEALLFMLRDRPNALARIAAFEFASQFLLFVETYWALVSMGVIVSLLTASILEILTKLANVAVAGVAE